MGYCILFVTIENELNLYKRRPLFPQPTTSRIVIEQHQIDSKHIERWMWLTQPSIKIWPAAKRVHKLRFYLPTNLTCLGSLLNQSEI